MSSLGHRTASAIIALLFAASIARGPAAGDECPRHSGAAAGDGAGHGAHAATTRPGSEAVGHAATHAPGSGHGAESGSRGAPCDCADPCCACVMCGPTAAFARRTAGPAITPSIVLAAVAPDTKAAPQVRFLQPFPTGPPLIG